jgi:hypothetical protein
LPLFDPGAPALFDPGALPLSDPGPFPCPGCGVALGSPGDEAPIAGGAACPGGLGPVGARQPFCLTADAAVDEASSAPCSASAAAAGASASTASSTAT